jgi:hypothetical protein
MPCALVLHSRAGSWPYLQILDLAGKACHVYLIWPILLVYKSKRGSFWLGKGMFGLIWFVLVWFVFLFGLFWFVLVCFFIWLVLACFGLFWLVLACFLI